MDVSPETWHRSGRLRALRVRVYAAWEPLPLTGLSLRDESSAQTMNIFGAEVCRPTPLNLKHPHNCQILLGYRGEGGECTSFFIRRCPRAWRSRQIDVGTQGHEQDPPVRFDRRD